MKQVFYIYVRSTNETRYEVEAESSDEAAQLVRDSEDEEKYFPISRAVDRTIPDTDEDISAATSGDTDGYIILWG